MDPEAMKSKMQANLAKLKESNPELAGKMEKIGNRMGQLMESGSDPMSAMNSIQKEFGAPTQAEMEQLQKFADFNPGEALAGMPMQNSSLLEKLQSKLQGVTAGGNSDQSSDLMDAFFSGNSRVMSSSESSGKVDLGAQLRNMVSKTYGQGNSNESIGQFLKNFSSTA